MFFSNRDIHLNTSNQIQATVTQFQYFLLGFSSSVYSLRLKSFMNDSQTRKTSLNATPPRSHQNDCYLFINSMHCLLVKK